MMNIISKLGKIGVKLYLYMLACVLTTLIGISGVEIMGGYLQGKELAKAIQRQMAETLSKEILGPLKEIEKGMTLSTYSKGVLEQGINERFKFYLEKLLKNYPAIFETSALDNNGNEIVIASRLRTTTKQDMKNRALETSFKESMKGRVYYSDIFYKYGSKPFMLISTPITLFGGKTAGVLIAEIDLLDLQKIISATKIGKEGYAYLVDNQGFIIAHPSLAQAFSRFSVLNLNVIRNAYAEPNKVHYEVYKNPRGKDVLCSAKVVENLGWIMVVAQPTRDVYVHARRSLFIFLTAFFTLITIVTFLTYRISRKIATPILELNNAAGKISTGDLSARVDIKTGDEIQALGDKFNEMAVSLNDLYQNMEQRISERTRGMMLLFSFTSAVSQTLNIAEVLKIAGEELITTYNLNGFVGISDEDVITDGIDETNHSAVMDYLVDNGWFEFLIKEQKSVLIPLDPAVPPRICDINGAEINAITIHPIIHKGIPRGYMILLAADTAIMDADMISITDTCMLQLGVGIANSELHKQTQELSLTDQLTSLGNRRFFEIKMGDEFERFNRYQHSAALLMIDIDHFKKVNDAFGHQSGDVVLAIIGKRIKSFFRKSDISSRYGGEEFAVLLPETNKEQASTAAERLRNMIAETLVKIDVEPYEIKITISIGVSDFDKSMEYWQELVKKADKALYRAKETGRNRVVCD